MDFYNAALIIRETSDIQPSQNIEIRHENTLFTYNPYTDILSITTPTTTRKFSNATTTLSTFTELKETKEQLSVAIISHIRAPQSHFNYYPTLRNYVTNLAIALNSEHKNQLAATMQDRANKEAQLMYILRALSHSDPRT
jgi:hypothetical protein